MTMAKTAPLASQGELLKEKTDVGIGISSVESVSVAMDKIINGRWQKKLSNENVIWARRNVQQLSTKKRVTARDKTRDGIVIYSSDWN